jgi:hypothetical protein
MSSLCKHIPSTRDAVECAATAHTSMMSFLVMAPTTVGCGSVVTNRWRSPMVRNRRYALESVTSWCQRCGLSYSSHPSGLNCECTFALVPSHVAFPPCARCWFVQSGWLGGCYLLYVPG